MRHGLGFHNRHSAGGFQPISLFTGGVQGAWYDPSDFGASGTDGVGTLFQDAAGTTPVTAVEQAVGLMLDKSKGLVLGPELVTNGDFSQGSTGWTAEVGWTISSGSASYSAGSTLAFGNVYQLQPAVAGRLYKFSLTVTNRNSVGRVAVRFGASTYSPDITANGQFTCYLIAPSTGNIVVGVQHIPGGSAGTVTITVDDFSVRELPGNHAYQSINTSRPTLRARYNLLTRSEEFDNGVWAVDNGGATNPVVTANAGIAPDGTMTADRIVLNKTGGTFSRIQQSSISTIGAQYVFSVWMKTFTPSTTANVGIRNELTGINCVVTDTWARFSVATTATAASIAGQILLFDAITGNDETADILAWGAQLVPTAVFPSNTYQRIGAATDYATGAAFPPYLFFDGTDDSMLTNSVDFATVTSDGQARRNLLTNPTQFDAAGWTNSLTVTANNAVAPDGTNTADTVADSASSAAFYSRQSYSGLANTNYTFSCYIKAGTQNFVCLNIEGASAHFLAVFDLSTQTVTQTDTTSGTHIASSITPAGGGWYRCEVTGQLTVAVSRAVIAFAPAASGNVFTSAGYITYLGTGTTAVIWGAQLETGSTATAFQNIGTDRMLVVAGVTKSSDAAIGVVAELSATSASNNGTFAIFGPTSSAINYLFRSRGTANSEAGADFAAPNTKVVTGIADIGVDTCVLRVNGAQVATDTTDQGTGNYGNYPLFIGRRNNASLPFNGNIYSLIIAGQSYSSGQISSTESWAAAKTPLGTI